MADAPDDQLQPILDLLADAPSLEHLGVDGARQQFEALGSFAPTYDVHDEVDITIPGPDGDLDARVFRAAAEARPTLLYFHGGGFVVGSIDTHANICQRLAEQSGWHVVSVAYRLAPEHPFPAALEDACAAAEWVADNPDAVGSDGTLAVGGDSAGGNLAAGVSLLARDAREDRGSDLPDIAHQVLYYPVCGSPLAHYESRESSETGYFLEQSTMEWFHDQYVQSPVHNRNEYLAPLLVDDYTGLPSATVVTAGLDPLRDEGCAYAEALDDDGVDVFHAHYDSMVHGFVSFLGMVAAADDAVRATVSGLDAAVD